MVIGGFGEVGWWGGRGGGGGGSSSCRARAGGDLGAIWFAGGDLSPASVRRIAAIFWV